MDLTRRTFLKGAGATGGALVASRWLPLGGQSGADIGPITEDTVLTACWIGKQDCGMLAHRVNGRVIKFEGHPTNPRNVGTLCPKGMAQIMSIYDPNRIKTPLVRTNEKGVSGKWRQASWDEALTLVANKIKEVRAKDPAQLLWRVGRDKAKPFYGDAFVGASGATKQGHGGLCSDAGFRASEYTIGLQGVLHPDFKYTRYLLAWGWNLTGAGGNKLCWITWPKQFLDAKAQGMKVTVIDPRLRGVARFADEWLPIRPGTDLALALALSNALVAQGTIDTNYLKRYTNGPYLVGDDGFFVRVDGKEQVWDSASGSAKPFDAKGVDASLEGKHEVRGRAVKPAFQLFKDHIDRYTPEWAAEVCGVPAAGIKRIAQELGDNAMIGQTMKIKGRTIPYRPVAAMASHMSQQELGFQAVRAIHTVFMLLGAVGAVGGPRPDFAWKEIHENYKKLDNVEIKDPPYNFLLDDSKFFPINSASPSMTAKVMADPAKYGVKKIPEMAIIHMTNPLVSSPDRKAIAEGYGKIKFITVISPWLSETADHYADVVLPAATIEKYEGPLDATDQYTAAVSLRMPPMDPLFQSRGEIDIYLDLCEKAGILHGKGGYLDRLNTALKLRGSHALPLDRKPRVPQIFNRWAKSQGIKGGLDFFRKNGVDVKGDVPVDEYYGYAANPPFLGAVHRLYGESLQRYRKEMRTKGADKAFWQDYTALPTWRKPTMDASPQEYNLYLISFKLIEHKQSRTSFMPLLAELAPEQHLAINPASASARGISDGDEVWVESHNAVTGETRKIKTKASCTEAIRPDTVGMPHHYGLWTQPGAKGEGPTPNTIFYTGEGYVANTMDQSYHVKVRVSKA